MKKFLTSALAMLLTLSCVAPPPAAFAADHSTKVEYTADAQEEFLLTVPASLEAGKSGDVTLKGKWPSNKTFTVSADKTVTMACDIGGNQVLNVTFAGIELAGSNTAEVSETKQVSVDSMTALFGNWSGTFRYNLNSAGSSSGGDNSEGGDAGNGDEGEPSACDHDYAATVTAPTCTTAGYTTHVCSKCGETYTDSKVSALTHDLSTTTTPATCTIDGKSVTTCSRCDYKTESVITKLNHNYTATTTAPTCTAIGYVTHTCTRCGDTYTDSETTMLGHDLKAITTPATCTTDGKIVVTCSRCDYKTESTIAKLNHNYTSVVTAPTCTAKGYTTHTCTKCGNNYKDAETDALGHNINAVTGYCNNCNVNLAANAIDFTIKSTNRAAIGYAGAENEKLVIPTYFIGDGNNKTTLGSIYKVTSIESSAFSNCVNLTDVIIPNSVTSIGDEAFYKCTGLTNITIPNSITSIGNNAFNGCKKLTEIVIPSGVTSIKALTFSGCSNLTTITIPNTVSSFEGGTFFKCSNLTKIIFKGTQEQWNSISKTSGWDQSTGNYIIYCTDGNIAKS